MVVDDSVLARKVIKDELGKDPEIEVIGTAGDPFDASEKIEKLNPDVMTLDLEMPKMDGLTFLKSLMRHHPMPVVVVSAYTTKGSRLALEALESGAVDIVPKPGMTYNVQEMSAELISKVKAAAMAKVGKKEVRKTSLFRQEVKETPEGTAPRRKIEVQPELPVLPRIGKPVNPGHVIAMGSSTGGTKALQHILTQLPDNMPPILVVQHMPEGFTKAFSDRLNSISALEIKEAENRDEIKSGRVLIAPGNKHMTIKRMGSRLQVELDEGPKVCRQRPAVENLFNSVGDVIGKNAIGVILTGMGNDGAMGMLKMKQAGATNIAEDEESCVVFGMPKEAIKAGGVDHVMHLHKIAEFLTKMV